ncbi:MAG: hypothetical protein RUMPE_00162 [Eubacteriales bacterium SKADARSKE-1]|nr:hypothetical protein [Eubacteriales bacterium SKADARSKE-1]
MPDDFKSDIEGYFIDYRNNTDKTDFKSYERTTKTVTAQMPVVKKPRQKSEPIINKTSKAQIPGNTKIKPVKKATKFTAKKRTEDIYINAKPSLKGLIYRVAFGCIILSLTIIGFMIFLSTLSQTTTPVINEQMPLNNYSNFLASVVMHDPEPFDCPQNADKQMVLASSIWRAISQNGTQKYDCFDERGFSLIPVADIISASNELFGPDCNINTSERIFGSFFSFEPGDNNFHICAISNQNSCLPYIKDTLEENGFLILTVGYISRDDSFLKPEPLKTAEPNPLKYMKYKLKNNENTNSYYIYAIENIL